MKEWYTAVVIGNHAGKTAELVNIVMNSWTSTDRVLRLMDTDSIIETVSL